MIRAHTNRYLNLSTDQLQLNVLLADENGGQNLMSWQICEHAQ
jgi:hypothetical protein